MIDKTMIEMAIKIHIRGHQLKTGKIRDKSKIKVSTPSGSQIEEVPEQVVEAIEEVTEMTFNGNKLIETVSTQRRIHLSSKMTNMTYRRVYSKNREVVIRPTISSNEVVVADLEVVIEVEALTINAEALITKRI